MAHTAFPSEAPPLNRLNFSEGATWRISCPCSCRYLAVVRKSKYGPIYTPITQGTIVHPGFRGGVLWGGGSFDPKSGRLFVNSDESVNVATLSKAAAGKDYPYELTQRAHLLDPKGIPGDQTAMGLHDSN